MANFEWIIKFDSLRNRINNDSQSGTFHIIFEWIIKFDTRLLLLLIEGGAYSSKYGIAWITADFNCYLITVK